MKLTKTVLFPVASTVLALGIASFSMANEDTFTSLDTNEDGVISKEEAQAHSTLASMFDDVDANGDGVITYDEFSTAGLGE
uniref:EF-hand domain-containing protein n=1 Tax=Ningiella ruwaisensis TaxID=2364274 RepID=UPI00109F7351|nr:EF-hand domain-containing protein [Ningiella ruwaisensis]